MVRFLHIFKTGGTAIRAAFMGVEGFLVCPHGTTLAQCPPGEPVLFCLRDPVERAVSGFYSRKRQGAPAYWYPWSLTERQVFDRYQSIEALCAEGVDRTARVLGRLRPTASRYWHWLGSPELLRERTDDIARVLWLPTLAHDLAVACSALGLPAVTLPAPDKPAAHAAPAKHRAPLSQEARAVLTKVYEDDYDCLTTVLSWYRPDL